MNGLSPGKYVPSSPICTEPFSSRYTVQEDIGRGKFAVVRKCVNIETGEVVAAKVIRKRRKGKSCREEILREVVMLELAMAHPRLVSLREVFETQSELILVTEYCSGGELFDECVIKESFKEDDVKRLLAQILEGLAYLHDNNIVHLDLKPQNILLTKPFPEGEIKICDLGFACLTNTGEDIRDIIGTPDYVAPEVLDYEPLNIQTDMWSLGVLTYVMLTACSPFVGDTQQETFCNITQIKMEYPDELFGHINPLAKDFISKLLVKRPRDRMTARQCLDHPWLRDVKNRMSIIVPTSDHSEELAHDMVVPSNWHMSPDRRSSISNTDSLVHSISSTLASGPSISLPDSSSSEEKDIVRKSLSEEKDTISQTLSHIDIDRQSVDRSSSASFETCPESIEGVNSANQSDASPFDSETNMAVTSTAAATHVVDDTTLSSFAVEVVQSVTKPLQTNPPASSDAGRLQNNQTRDPNSAMENYIESNSETTSSTLRGTSQSEPLSSDATTPTTPTTNILSSPRDNNKLDNSKKRMSMEIPPKKAKCIEDGQDEATTGRPETVTAGLVNPSELALRGSGQQCKDQQGQACNGIEDFRNVV